MKFHILVAEDNATNRLFIEQILRSEGHAVHMVFDGDQALAALVENGYDIAILDEDMPFLGGIEVCQAYKMMQSRDDRTSFIMLHGDKGRAELDVALGSGFMLCLPKPVDAADLLSFLREHAVRLATAANAPPKPETQLSELFDTSHMEQIARMGSQQKFIEKAIFTFISDTEQNLSQMASDLAEHRYQSMQSRMFSIDEAATHVGARAVSRLAKQYASTPVPEMKFQAPRLLANLTKKFEETKPHLIKYARQKRHLMAVK